MNRTALRISYLLFGSGLCSLVYQTVWLREFRLVFGASTAASAAVLAIFMGGLGLGGWLIGSRVDRSSNPLALYGNLELTIAVTSSITPLLLVAVQAIYSTLGGTASLGTTGGAVVRLLLSTLVLSVPTIAMGGTLPAAARAAETERDTGRRGLAFLYGANALGAVTGASLSTFLLLEMFGNRRTLWLACLVNLLVGLAARSWSRSHATSADARTSDAAESYVDAEPLPEEAPASSRVPPVFVLVSSGVVGFAFFLMEMVWYRMLGPLLGGSSFTFGLILAVALFGIGAGGAAYAVLGGRRPTTLAAFALTCALEGLFIALPFAAGDRIAVVTALLRPLGNLGFQGHLGAWTVVTSVVLLPASLVAGFQFPVLISLLGRGRENVGRHVGHAYAANTAGAILGSLAGGFGLLPLLSATGTWRLVVGLLFALGCVTIVLDVVRSSSVRRHSTAALALVASILLILVQGPTAAWRHSPIGAGRVDLTGRSGNELLEWLSHSRRDVVWQVDGVESSVALLSESGYAFVVNGKSDGHARGDAGTQVMGGLLGALLHPNPKSALVVGLGTGSTAGWLGAVPSIDRVDVVELEPAILHVADVCTPVNHDVLHNPKVHVSIGDARELLTTTSNRYDIVFSEPSNPYRAGVASLYTQDFYRSAARRMTDDGLFLQWLQGYEVDGQTIRTIVATLASVFPSVEIWQTQSADLILVGSMKPLVHDVAAIRQRVGVEPFRSALYRAWRCSDAEGVFGHFLAGDTLARSVLAAEHDRLNTDDLNLVEFGFARVVGARTNESVSQLISTSQLMHADRPTVTGGDLDWRGVAHARATVFVAEGNQPPSLEGLSAADMARERAKAAFAAQKLGDATSIIRTEGLRPVDPIEVEMFAECLADAGDDSALPYIEQIRELTPAEADMFLGLLRSRQNDLSRATDAFVAGFTAYRTDPWPTIFVVIPILEAALNTAAAEPTRAAARRLYDALDQPFSVSLANAQRLHTQFLLARMIDGANYTEITRHVIAATEPNVYWEKSFLSTRLNCYEALGDPRVETARRDVETWVENEPREFGAGLVPNAP